MDGSMISTSRSFVASHDSAYMVLPILHDSFVFVSFVAFCSSSLIVGCGGSTRPGRAVHKLAEKLWQENEVHPADALGSRVFLIFIFLP
jgi:hypothetical protein